MQFCHYLKSLSAVAVVTAAMASLWVAPANADNPLLPASDPDNAGNWQLNTKVSDEFNGDSLDLNKWYVSGTDGQFYIWKGRAPSQFAPHNAYVEDGKLILRTQWQPDYPFVGKPPQRQEIKAYENITTAAVISHHTVLFGYMEVKVKIPDAPMTGAFWGTGYQQELDVFELVGLVTKGNKNPETTFVTSFHDWRPGHPKKNKVWKHPHKTPGRTAENFYVYGVEWLPDGLKMYFNGELVHQVQQQELGDRWVLNNPMELWFDSEVFPWHGIPEQQHLPAFFEIDYVRVWQRPDDNQLDRAFFGFEGPLQMNPHHKPAPRMKSAEFWFIDDQSSVALAVTDFADNIYTTGRKSLRFDLGKTDKQAESTAFSPAGSVELGPGRYRLTANVWVSEQVQNSQLQVVLESPWQQLKPIALDTLPRGQWREIAVEFNQQQASAAKDRMRLVFKGGNQGQVYLDDIAIRPLK
ncbi:family 16 glycosylhydrolase [Neiella sp. HB171785]|uniref:Family 16 glycosylhydrolase n=1 Tax=Neiella litorisoli TaxID=2771431 RepID=A0A8J6QI99_9GAMM|nr:family 16 glycosylhydrolase [Neiella litorisoli]MBD1388346.1 family 16 glycosylhydrolase [Neiella litorisoli]